MYTCGLTVNYLMHIGHARCYVFWDVVERYLRYLGYEVQHLSNITDISVDDNILKQLDITNETFQQLVTRNTINYILDRRALGISDPFTYTIATQYIAEMIALIQQLLNSGHAYVTEDGVYFRLRSYPQYGQLAGINPDQLQEGASGRIAKDEYDKEKVGDFALWKRAKSSEPHWHSPWGPGRPGWHIECSAMSMKYLRTPIDISGGGEDNLFPHHENSIAQSESITNQQYVRYWMHVRHLLLNGEKMSKSTGNFLTARKAITGYGPAAIRLFTLSAHYRKPLDFNIQEISRIQKKLHQLQTLITLLEVHANQKVPKQPIDTEIQATISEAEIQFQSAMNNDFNMGRVLNQLYRLINSFLKSLQPEPQFSSQMAHKILGFFKRIGIILFGDLYETKVALQPDPQIRQLVQALLTEREYLRKTKQYDRADEIRTALKAAGIEVVDSSTGPRWWPIS